MLGKRIAKILVFTVLMVFVAVKASAEESGEEMFDWEPLMEAITQVESEGNAKARNGNCCGAMQIKPILVEDCNLILRSRGSKKKYTLKDRFNVKKSKEMFVLIMSKYNPTNDIERAIRIWNGGVNYTVKSTQKYYNKVMAAYKS